MNALYETIYYCIIKVQLQQYERLSKAYVGSDSGIPIYYLKATTDSPRLKTV